MPEKKILVVDDEEDLVNLIGKALSGEGYDVTLSMSAQEAIEKAKAVGPDLILMDIILPDMQGPEAVRLLGDDQTKDIPIIFLSGIATRDQSDEATTQIRVGDKIFKCLSKPFTTNELMTEIRREIG